MLDIMLMGHTSGQYNKRLKAKRNNKIVIEIKPFHLHAQNVKQLFNEFKPSGTRTTRLYTSTRNKNFLTANNRANGTYKNPK